MENIKNNIMPETLTEEQWLQYTRDGYLRLGKILSDEHLETLQKQIDAIMLGEADVEYDRMMMQEDSESGAYDEAGPQTRGHKGGHLNYRKIQDLEFDPYFLRYMQRPLFRHVCSRVYGAHIPIGCFRAMFMNKPANRGTWLPWHQDRWNNLDRDPLLTVWTALDPCTKANGCVQIIPGSHRFGVVNPQHSSGFMTEEQAAELCDQSKRVFLEMEAGEVCLLHNWLMHASDVNRSDQSRRGFSVCYADARTRNIQTGESAKLSIIFGEGALEPDAVAAKQPA